MSPWVGHCKHEGRRSLFNSTASTTTLLFPLSSAQRSPTFHILMRLEGIEPPHDWIEASCLYHLATDARGRAQLTSFPNTPCRTLGCSYRRGSVRSSSSRVVYRSARGCTDHPIHHLSPSSRGVLLPSLEQESPFFPQGPSFSSGDPTMVRTPRRHGASIMVSTQHDRPHSLHGMCHHGAWGSCP